MKSLKIELTVEELSLVTTLIADQLFRREFIDPKMPGYKKDPAQLASAKELLARLKLLGREASDPAGRPVPRRAGQYAGNPNGVPDAV